jgi:hypothetical protein
VRFVLRCFYRLRVPLRFGFQIAEFILPQEKLFWGNFDGVPMNDHAFARTSAIAGRELVAQSTTVHWLGRHSRHSSSERRQGLLLAAWAMLAFLALICPTCQVLFR